MGGAEIGAGHAATTTGSGAGGMTTGAGAAVADGAPGDNRPPSSSSTTSYATSCWSEATLVLTGASRNTGHRGRGWGYHPTLIVHLTTRTHEEGHGPCVRPTSRRKRPAPRSVPGKRT